MRVLLVDDDAGLRALLRTTFDVFELDVAEADGAAEARRLIEEDPPDVVILDVLMPGMDGIEFCRELKANRETRDIGVVLLTGTEGGSRVAADAAGADAYVPKPFSPLELLAVVERLAGGIYGVPFRASRKGSEEEQLLLYARDLRHLLQIERGQRSLVQQAYRETVAALASALESKDTGTAPALAARPALRDRARTVDEGRGRRAIRPSSTASSSTTSARSGSPTACSRSRDRWTSPSARLMQTHTLLGEQMLGGVAFLQGEGVSVVRSHHERWDGDGYPDRLARDEIPLGARIFAVADTLDAITSDRPYRAAGRWSDAHEEIVRQRGKQFDPGIVDAFRDCEPALRFVRREFAAA